VVASKGSTEILVTRDGGETWEVLLVNETSNFMGPDFEFIGKDHFLVLEYNKIYESVDGGQSWEVTELGDGSMFLTDLYASDTARIAVGDNDSIVYWDGENWVSAN